jgi:hypothetical protein
MESDMMGFVPENRRNARYPVGVSVRLLLDSSQTGMRVEIVDRSASGMCIRAPGLALAPDAQVKVRIARQDGQAATMIARIVRHDDRGIAFHFESLGSADRELLSTPGFWTTAELIELI